MKKIIKTPFEIVASVLNAPLESITEDSGWGKDAGWDSMNQVIIIGMLEKEYGITIPDSDIEKYSNMKSINEIFKKLDKT